MNIAVWHRITGLNLVFWSDFSVFILQQEMQFLVKTSDLVNLGTLMMTGPDSAFNLHSVRSSIGNAFIFVYEMQQRINLCICIQCSQVNRVG